MPVMNDSQEIMNEDENEDINAEETEEDDQNYKKVSSFNIISSNPRSLTPKIDCLVEYLNELDTSLAFF